MYRLEKEGKSMGVAEDAKRSRSNYVSSLDDYLSGKGKFNREVDNPVYGVIEKLGDVSENEKRRKWERAAALMGLNSVFSTLGGVISASSGVKPVMPSKRPFDYAMAQIDRADKNSRADYNRYYQSQLAEAIRSKRRSDAISDNYLDGLNDLRRDDARENIYNRKIESDFEKQQIKDNAAMERLERVSQTRNMKTTARSSVKYNPETYVKNHNGRRVPLYKDDVTKLYQIGKMYDINKPFAEAGNENVRKREFDVLMQRAYLLYERDKKMMDGKLNSDIKSSDPFTLKLK